MDEVLIAKLIIQGADGIQIRSGELYNCASAPRVLCVPEGVVALRSGSLSGQSLLEFVTLPSTLERVGYGVFANCCNLHTIRLGIELRRFADILLYGNRAELYYVSGH